MMEAFSGEKIAIIGHLHGLFRHDVDTSDVRKKVLDAIKSQSPKAVFFLGDFVHGHSEKPWIEVNKFVEELGVPAYFSPGNHDYDPSGRLTLWAPYRELVEHRNRKVVMGNRTILLFDSHSFDDETKNFIESNVPNIDERSIIMTHYRIWNQEKVWSYLDQVGLLKSKPLVMAGNSRYDGSGCSVDYINDIWCYHIGMGGIEKGAASFTTFDLDTEKLYPHIVDISNSSFVKYRQNKSQPNMSIRKWFGYGASLRRVAMAMAGCFLAGLVIMFAIGKAILIKSDTITGVVCSLNI